MIMCFECIYLVFFQKDIILEVVKSGGLQDPGGFFLQQLG